MTKTVGAAAITLLFLVPAVQVGADEETLELPFSLDRSGPGWVFYKVHANDATFQAFYTHTIQGQDVQSAFFVWNEDFQPVGNFTFSTGSMVGAYVHTEGDDEDAITVDAYQDGTGWGWGWTTINSSRLHGSTFYVLHWLAGGIDERSHGLAGGDGVELLAVEEDDSAFLYTVRDFEGPLVAQTGLLVGGGHAVIDGSLEHTASEMLVATIREDRFFLGTWAGDLAAETPMGRYECPCTWDGLAADQQAEPGIYRFEMSSVGAGYWASGPAIYVSGAEVRIPG